MKYAACVSALIVLAIAAVWISTSQVRPASTASPLAQADSLASSGKAKSAIEAYDALIDARAASTDRVVQDEVAAARIRKGFALGKLKRFAEARSAFLAARDQYRGTGKLVPGEGGAVDQAAYQAAVCLLAMGEEAQGKKELLKFVDDFPESPKLGSAYKRLQKLCTPHEIDALTSKLDRAETARSKKRLVEMAKCGPKAILHLAHLVGAASPSEDALASACRTDETGTTMAGAVRGLEKCGLSAYAYEVNRSDISKVPLPALWLSGGHYLVLKRVGTATAQAYDPLTGKDEVVMLPFEKDPDFRAIVLALQPIGTLSSDPS